MNGTNTEPCANMSSIPTISMKTMVGKSHHFPQYIYFVNVRGEFQTGNQICLFCKGSFFICLK